MREQPEGTGRGEAYNPYLKELTALIDELKIVGTRFDASPTQVDRKSVV